MAHITKKYVKETLKQLKKTLIRHLKKHLHKMKFNAICTTDKGPGNFYQLFKVHKEHDKTELPPGRPIISGCNSITEN
jgi:hypothetical protein